MAAFKNFRRHSVVVYINSKTKSELQHVSPVVVGRFRDKSLGGYIPKAVIVSADQELWFASSKYKDMSESKEFSRVRKLVKAGLDGEIEQGPLEYATGWQVKDSGNAYVGKFVRLDDDGKKLTVKLDDSGNDVGIPMDTMCPGAQKYARILGGLESAVEAKDAEPVMEAWESAAGGKTITAMFKSLSGTKLTLQLENGRTTTFDISKLSDKSQQRAKELAGGS